MPKPHTQFKSTKDEALNCAHFFAALNCASIDEYNNSTIQLFPYGEFRATDGRPDDVEAWIIADENGRDVADLANSYKNNPVVDYEHQTLNAIKNGQPAPAAGWIEHVYLTPRGLFASMSWTDKAAGMIKTGEYKYISPVFSYDQNGYVRKLFNAALTNNPALDGMDEVIAASLTQLNQSTELTDQLHISINQTNNKKNEGKMDKALLCQLLGLANDASDEKINTQLAALSKHQSLSNTNLTAVCDNLMTLDKQISDGWDGNNPDPAKFVSLGVVDELKQQIAALTKNHNDKESGDLIKEALTNGKLLPAQKEWAENLAKSNIDALKSYIKTAPTITGLTSNQSDDADEQTKTAALTSEQERNRDALGMTTEQYIKTVVEDNKE